MTVEIHPGGGHQQRSECGGRQRPPPPPPPGHVRGERERVRCGSRAAELSAGIPSGRTTYALHGVDRNIRNASTARISRDRGAGGPAEPAAGQDREHDLRPPRRTRALHERFEPRLACALHAPATRSQLAIGENRLTRTSATRILIALRPPRPRVPPRSRPAGTRARTAHDLDNKLAGARRTLDAHGLARLCSSPRPHGASRTIASRTPRR